MHHWGPTQLSLLDPYTLRAESNNVKDCYAVEILETKHPNDKMAYLSREWAKILQPLLPYSEMSILHVRELAVVITYEKGPQHNCRVVLKCSGAGRKQMFETYLTLHKISYRIQNIN